MQSGSEQASLQVSASHISEKIQSILDQYDGMPSLANILRKLANYYVVLSNVSYLQGNCVDMLEYGCRAVDMLGRIERRLKTADDFHYISRIYTQMASHAGDTRYVPLLQFGSNYFSGRNPVSFSVLNKIVSDSNEYFDKDCCRNRALLSMMKLLQENAGSDRFPDNDLKAELKSYYYQIRYKAIMLQQQMIEDKYLDDVCEQLLNMIEMSVRETEFDKLLVELDAISEPGPATSVASRARFFETQPLLGMSSLPANRKSSYVKK